eukprot:CAMPEP_0184993866 /NCGR_PEP_ID=MMETSP1098-20130426/47159_1 /TAXON_ID=89044 /ORGANISM="Spumella elongata, Strain CCAP 955/1" /LENGTH=987 /DNA_ID=CAMNT_0027519809 /DNA_START=13 /DNA_END=2976 /DNA_ORIENTATION=+
MSQSLTLVSISARATSDMDLDTDLQFLHFDDENLTEAELRRITQLIDSRQENTDTQSVARNDTPILRECKLFFHVKSVEDVPSKVSCMGMCTSKYQCEVEVVGNRKVYTLQTKPSDIGDHYNTLTNVNSSPFDCDGKRGHPSWDLAEYYGETKITIKLMKRKFLKSVVVGKKTMFLSELFEAQTRATKRQSIAKNEIPTWSVDYAIPLTTTLKAKRRYPQHATNSWLSTAKNASSSLSSPVAYNNLEEGKPMMLVEEPAIPSRGQAYVPVSNQLAATTERTGAQVLIRIDFRLVQLRNCQHLCFTPLYPSLAALCSTVPTSRAFNSIGATPVSGKIESTPALIRCSELHLLAMCAPPGVVIDVMRGLSRREALAGALALRTTSDDDSALSVAQPAQSSISTSLQGNLRSVGGGQLRSLPRDNPARLNDTAGWTPLECALLHQQEDTVLEILQRCGGLCFTDLTAGQATPLHAAVRGGSALCVEYICRYLKRYGAKSVTGPSARLWNSSMNARLDWKDQDGDTALALACRLPRNSRAHSMVLYLLMLGADPGALNDLNGYTPLMYACQAGAVKIVTDLLSPTKSEQDVMDAILNVGDVNSILNNSINLDVEPAVRDQIQAAIADAAHSARSSALATHLQSNPRSRNILRGQNPLDGGYFNPLSLFLCEPCRRDKAMGRHAMHIAAEQGNMEIVQALLQIGMSHTDIDFFSDNSVHIAARRGHAAVVGILVNAEQRAWAAHQQQIRQGKSLETMQHRVQPLLVMNCYGDSPVEAALDAGHFHVAEQIITGAVEIYSGDAVEDSVWRRLLRALDEALVKLSIAAEESRSSAPPSPLHLRSVSNTNVQANKNGSESGSRKSGKHSPAKGSKEDGEKCIAQCRALLLKRLTQKDSANKGHVDLSEKEIETFTVNTRRHQVLDSAYIDDVADEEEYLMALSSLGMKYITDNLSSYSSPVGGDVTNIVAGDAASAVVAKDSLKSRDEPEEKKEM